MRAGVVEHSMPALADRLAEEYGQREPAQAVAVLERLSRTLDALRPPGTPPPPVTEP